MAGARSGLPDENARAVAQGRAGLVDFDGRAVGELVEQADEGDLRGREAGRDVVVWPDSVEAHAAPGKSGEDEAAAEVVRAFETERRGTRGCGYHRGEGGVDNKRGLGGWPNEVRTGEIDLARQDGERYRQVCAAECDADGKRVPNVTTQS